MNNREAMQKEFEAWAEKELYALDKREGSDIYRNVITRNAWLGWNAALSAQAQQDHIPDVGKMVQSQAQQTQEPAKCSHDLADQCKVAASCLTYNESKAEAVAKHLLLEASQALRRSQAQEPESKWISVDDRLPEDTGTRYQVFAICKHAKIEAKDVNSPYYDKPKIVVAQDWNIREWPQNYSFWMVIPPAPEGESK